MDAISRLTSQFESLPLGLTLTDDATSEKTVVVADIVLGKGLSKRAFDIGEGRVLLIPNLAFTKEWTEIVNEECSWSQFILRQGILGVHSRKVQVAFEYTKGNMPAYVCDSFDAIAYRDNIFVIDRAHPKTSTWKTPLVGSLSPAKWKSVLSHLADDCLKLAGANVELCNDSVNIAVTCGDDHRVSSIRHFLFDYSVRGRKSPLPDQTPQDIKQIVENACSLAREFLSSVLEYEKEHLQIGDLEAYLFYEKLAYHVETQIEAHLPDEKRESPIPEFLRKLTTPQPQEQLVLNAPSQ